MTNDYFSDAIPVESKEPPNICVVRLSTTAWADGRGVYFKKSLTFLRRQCSGWNILQEDVGTIGALEVMSKIANLDLVPDGVYRVVACNECRDWESGHVEDYDYMLMPETGGGS